MNEMNNKLLELALEKLVDVKTQRVVSVRVDHEDSRPVEGYTGTISITVEYFPKKENRRSHD